MCGWKFSVWSIAFPHPPSPPPPQRPPTTFPCQRWREIGAGNGWWRRAVAAGGNLGNDGAIICIIRSRGKGKGAGQF